LKKAILFLFLLCSSWSVEAENAFEKNCIPCHARLDISLRKTFMNALLVYGGKENMKAGLAYYFLYPRKDSSVMDEEFLRKNGVKVSMSVDPKELDDALEIYWQKYTVMGKLQ
jgi:hypothetical protein